VNIGKGKGVANVLLYAVWRADCEWLGASAHIGAGNKAWQSVAVVTVNMGDKDGFEFGAGVVAMQ